MEFFFLTPEFYAEHIEHTEIEQKADRPYICALVSIDGIKFAVPLRSHINHPYVLWTDKENHCGLDFSKTVVVTRGAHIDKSRKPYIRPNEFDELRGKEHLVQRRLRQYINTYIKAKLRMDVPRNRRICQYSTLQYFERYLTYLGK